MNALHNPLKQPNYRQFRDHDAFICRLGDFVHSRTLFIESILQSAQDDGYELIYMEEENVEELISEKHQQSTKFVESMSVKIK